MNKNKKSRRLLFSFIGIAINILCLSICLSSCISVPNDDKKEDDTDNDIINPPNNGDNNSDSEKPNEPDTKPENKPEPSPPESPDSKPEEPTPPITPPSNDPIIPPPNSNLINSESISLKSNRKLLPSQYLLDLNDFNNLILDKAKIIENFDNTIIIDVKYTILSLDDWKGFLSIKMNYKNKTNNEYYEFIFNFDNLAKLENLNYDLYLDVNKKNLLNAKEISSKSISNDVQAKLFFLYLKENGTSLIFKNNSIELPLEYLNFEKGLTFSGFSQSWFNTNKELKLNIQPKSLKVNVYKKNIDSVLSVNVVNYPSNLIGSNNKPIELYCSSALDYLLEKITTNDNYKDKRFASYYYYDIIYNQHMETQLQLSNDKWLKNVIHIIDGYDDKQYKPVLSNSISPHIDDEGNLIIQIQMQLSDEKIFSINSKELVIKSFLTLKNNLFYYNGSKNNKFNLSYDINNQEENQNYINDRKEVIKIKNEINNSDNAIVDVSRYFNKIDYSRFQKYIKLKFGDSEIVKSPQYDYYTSENDKISIENYFVELMEPTIQYNKNINCFQLKCKLTIQCEGVEYNSSTSDEMTVNITKINTPLE